MSSYQLAGALIGFATGDFSFAGLMKGFQYGSIAGAILDPATTGTDSIGPRLTDLSAQTSTYGASIPSLYGSMATIGNMIWLEGNKIKEVVTVKKVKAGGKGGKSKKVKITTYSYFATFAIGLCSGPIGGVRRIWVGGQLIYDANTTNIAEIVTSNRNLPNITIYTGTNTQVANSRIQADKGIANTPAYRGLSYIVFSDYALAKHGNSLSAAEVKVEIVGTQATVFKYDMVSNILVPKNTLSSYYTEALGSMNDICHIAQTSTYMHRTGNYFTLKLYKGPLLNGRVAPTFEKDVTFLQPYYPDLSNGWSLQVCSGNYDGFCIHWFQNVFMFNTEDHQVRFYTWDLKHTRDITARDFQNGGWAYKEYDAVGFVDWVIDEVNDLVAYYYPLAQSVSSGRYYPVVVRRWSTFEYLYTTNWEERKTTVGVSFYNGNLYMYSYDETSSHMNGIIEKYSPNGTLLRYVEGMYICSNYNAQMIAYAEDCFVLGYNSGVADVQNYQIVYQSHVSYPDSSPGFVNKLSGSGLRDGICWFATNVGLEYKLTLTPYYKYKTNGDAVLSSIVQKECLNSTYLTAADIDVTELTQQVAGYRCIGNNPIRKNIEPLQSAYFFDAYQQGYKIKFTNRGKSPSQVITYDKLGAKNGSSAEYPVSLKTERSDTLNLPTKISIKFLDRTRDYDLGEQYAERSVEASDNELAVEVPIVLTIAKAISIADILLYIYWLEREQYTITLPPQYWNIEPTDILTLTLPSGSIEVRVISTTQTQEGLVEVKATNNKASSYVSVAQGESGQSVSVMSSIIGPTEVILADLPCITSDLNTPAFCTLMYGFYAGWDGGTLTYSEDNWQTATELATMLSSGISGISTASSTFASKSSSTVDCDTVITIQLYSGELSSVTQSQMLNGENHFAYGVNGRWEIIAAQNIVLQGDGTYILSNLLRGRAGTDHNTGNHAVGDSILYLSDLEIVKTTSSNIGVLKSYKAVSSGQSLDDVSETLFTYSGSNLECLSPVYLNGHRKADRTEVFFRFGV